MNKKEIRNIIKEIAYKQNYEILDGTHENPVHIRIFDVCDIWSTGTLKIHGKKQFIKGQEGLEAFVSMMSDGVTPKSIQSSMRKEIDKLKAVNHDQSKIIARHEAATQLIFDRLDNLEFEVNAPLSLKA